MKVVERKPVPIYEVTCPECHSTIEYKKSEVHWSGFINCPVCGMEVWVSTIIEPKGYDLNEVEEEEK